MLRQSVRHTTSRYPEGHYVRIIGDVGNKDVVHPRRPLRPLTLPSRWVARCHAWPANEYSTPCESAVSASNTVSTQCALRRPM